MCHREAVHCVQGFVHVASGVRGAVPTVRSGCCPLHPACGTALALESWSCEGYRIPAVAIALLNRREGLAWRLVLSA